MNWKDVFDTNKLQKRMDIYETNEFIYTHTYYKLFSFNGKVYKTMNPKKFSMKEAETDIVMD